MSAAAYASCRMPSEMPLRGRTLRPIKEGPAHAGRQGLLMTTAETNDLITEVTQLPVPPGAALRLLWMLEDPRTSATDLGRLIDSDPALSTQVIGLSNTAFYGLSGKVSSAWRAVTVLGLATVRAIAT